MHNNISNESLRNACKKWAAHQTGIDFRCFTDAANWQKKDKAIINNVVEALVNDHDKAMKLFEEYKIKFSTPQEMKDALDKEHPYSYKYLGY